MPKNVEELYTIKPTPRVERLRKVYGDNFKPSQPTYTIYANRSITKVMKETEGKPMILRRAQAFAAVVW